MKFAVEAMEISSAWGRRGWVGVGVGFKSDVICTPSRQVLVVAAGEGDPSDLLALTPTGLKRPLGHFG